MRRICVGVLCLALLGIFVTGVGARDQRAGNVRFWKYWSPKQCAPDLAALDPGLLGLYSSAQVDTYNIVMYDFESMDWQGWTQVDRTAQIETFFHADDFVGLGGGSFGRLVPIEGVKSMWCGARPGTDEYMCGWEDAPGYGNNWNQCVSTTPFPFQGILHLSYHGVFDSEVGYDYTHVEYDAGGGSWVRIHSWDGVADTTVTHDIMLAQVATKLRFHFVSDRAWSDQDGCRNTDGACIIDSITIYDSNMSTIDFEDFEIWTVGAISDGSSMWHGDVEEPYGSYSDLWANLTERDFCNDNLGTQVAFFWALPVPWSNDTPFCEGPGGISAPCQDEMVVSPVIDLTKYSMGNDEVQDADIPEENLPALGGTVLRYTMYGDLPWQNLVFATCYVRNIDSVTGCPGQWRQVYDPTYLSPPGYYFMVHEISDLVGGDPIQIALGVWDACEVFYEGPPHCLYHTPAPWYDNVRVQRYKMTGPQWKYSEYNLFQDNFPQNELDIESYVRADAAIDIGGIAPIPMDEIVLTCTSILGGGIREGGITGGGEVYLYTRVTDVWPNRPGGAKPPLLGAQLEGTYGTYVSHDGSWTKIQCEATGIIDDQWRVDLNDLLLTRGYMVEYYFEAYDNADERSTLPRYADQGSYFEFACLPTGASKVLYVDDFHGRGTRRGNVEEYWNSTFAAVILPYEQPDRYDINSPSSMVGNGLASRAKLNQILYNEFEYSGYTIIIWDSGDLDVGTIGDGSPISDKADDCTLLSNWLDWSANDVGLLVCGDGIAYDLSENLTSTQATQLMSTWCGVDYVENSYFDATGGVMASGVITPLITGANTGIFWNEGAPFQCYAFGGCPIVNGFDVIAATYEGVEALMYPMYENEHYYAGIQKQQTNASLAQARTMWIGFSWMYVRNTGPDPSPMVRNLLFNEIYEWFQGIPNDDITPADVPTMYRLAQNFPNPFNPTTTIKFDIRKKGNVSLKIYNVAGQLVKTLVNDVLEAGSYTKDWKGLDNAGAKVASGVYFYRLDAGEYESVKKIVLLR